MSHERRIFVEGIAEINKEVYPKASDVHHLERVLRLKVGDAVTVVDEQHSAFYGTVSQLAPLRITIHRPAIPLFDQPPCPITQILCGLPKGPASDAIVDGASECGVPIITFWQATRSIPTDGGNRVVRWQHIAEAAAKQSGQSGIPSVTYEPTLADALSQLSPECSSRYLCALHPHARPLGLLEPWNKAGVILAFGPEGDITPEEETLFLNAGFQCITLGSSRLRCQTAVIAAISGAYALQLSRS